MTGMAPRAAGKEPPISALPRAIPLLPVPGADAPAADSGTGEESTDTSAPAGEADSPFEQEHLPQAERAPGRLPTSKQAVTDTSSVGEACHLGSVRHEPGRLVHVPVVHSLPGLVPRPLTLAEAVAEAITQAAYKQGSTDNLAALAVDLRPEWRSGSNFRGKPRELHLDIQDTDAETGRAGPELAREDAEFSLPWHSTGLIVPQHGKPFLTPRQSSFLLSPPCRYKPA